MASVQSETCPVCGVKIQGDLVNFSFGPPGTRSRLWQRVCKFVQKPGCINTEEEATAATRPGDRFG
ncbi:MAG: hypothetical protein SAJ12_01505 [Jaaginema sp. PMC 1079.18]|nr:hypothetical protein [Jaaginema sp. PMC 1080.18]MEC4849661.1 hypothetical protein [Jaaginema sp. PMC 1079.18]MEC4866079.1 hypothetical protein [Jaaginema sp. PMC 1078.18]